MQSIIKTILKFYIGILILVPVIYTTVIVSAGQHFKSLREKAEEVEGDHSGFTLLLIPILIVVSILSIIAIYFLKKQNNEILQIVLTLVLGVFPVFFYLIIFYFMFRYWLY